MRALTHLVPALATLVGGIVAAAPRECPPFGPVLPAPRNPSAHPLVQGTVAALSGALRELTAAFEHSAVSVGVRSVHEDEGPALLDLHHTPSDAGTEGGAREVTAQTVYRIGSVTKVFTVLAALKLAEKGVLRMDDPVGRWVKEFKGGDWDEVDALDEVEWDEVTVESVATHLSGIGADIFTDFAAFPGDWESLGFPKISKDAKRPDCSGLGEMRPCTRKDLTDAYTGHRPPIYPPFGSPVYSNAGTSIVGLVVEEAAGKDFEDVIRPQIYEPAGMKRTTMSTPTDNDDLFIPVNGTAWKADIGVMSPAGSMNSNTEDLLSFMTAVLRSKLLSPTGTRKWFRPATFTSGWASTVGAPFEMHRVDNVTRDGRIIDIITKGGDIIDYHSVIAMVPEFGVAISILAAGPEAAFMPMLLSVILKVLIPALDQAAKDEARQRFAGTYFDPATNSSLKISADAGPGLVLTDWVMRGHEVFPNLDRYNILRPNTADVKARFSSARLYPTGLENEKRTAWRAALPILDDDEASFMERATLWKDGHCLQWLVTDRRTYNYVAMDHFEFVFGEDGLEVVGIRARGFDVELTKTAGAEGGEYRGEELAAGLKESIVADGRMRLKMSAADPEEQRPLNMERVGSEEL